jgi:hypothetical protein
MNVAQGKSLKNDKTQVFYVEDFFELLTQKYVIMYEPQKNLRYRGDFFGN